MKYNKTPLTFDQQIDLLISRGLVVKDRKSLLIHLNNVSYYRLSAYWYSFRQDNDMLKPGTTFEVIWRRYTLDRQMRLLVMDAIERVEIAVRTQLTNMFTLKYGPFGHLNPANLPRIDHDRWNDLIRKIRDEAVHSQERFVEHYNQKYAEEIDLPLWMAVELMTFGMLFTFFGARSPKSSVLLRLFMGYRRKSSNPGSIALIRFVTFVLIMGVYGTRCLASSPPYHDGTNTLNGTSLLK
jgi:Abortive infection bacteriophage resistance protein